MRSRLATVLARELQTRPQVPTRYWIEISCNVRPLDAAAAKLLRLSLTASAQAGSGGSLPADQRLTGVCVSVRNRAARPRRKGADRSLGPAATQSRLLHLALRYPQVLVEPNVIGRGFQASAEVARTIPHILMHCVETCAVAVRPPLCAVRCGVGGLRLNQGSRLTTSPPHGFIAGAARFNSGQFSVPPWALVLSILTNRELITPLSVHHILLEVGE